MPRPSHPPWPNYPNNTETKRDVSIRGWVSFWTHCTSRLEHIYTSEHDNEFKNFISVAVTFGFCNNSRFLPSQARIIVSNDDQWEYWYILNIGHNARAKINGLRLLIQFSGYKFISYHVLLNTILVPSTGHNGYSPIWLNKRQKRRHICI